jgi:hypothetical protein
MTHHFAARKKGSETVVVGGPFVGKMDNVRSNLPKLSRDYS